MNIYSGKKPQTGALRISKNFGGLLLSYDLPFSSLEKETISIYIEKSKGKNVEIVKEESLRDYILLQTYGSQIIRGNLKNIAMRGQKPKYIKSFSVLIELAEGNINLEDGDHVVLSLDGVNPYSELSISTVSFPATTDVVEVVETKVFQTDQKSREFDVEDTDMVFFDKFDLIKDVELVYSNGETVEYTADEMIALSADGDNIQSVEDGKIVVNTEGVLCFPLVGVLSMDVTKDTGIMNIKTKHYVQY